MGDVGAPSRLHDYSISTRGVSPVGRTAIPLPLRLAVDHHGGRVHLPVPRFPVPRRRLLTAQGGRRRGRRVPGLRAAGGLLRLGNRADLQPADQVHPRQGRLGAGVGAADRGRRRLDGVRVQPARHPLRRSVRLGPRGADQCDAVPGRGRGGDRLGDVGKRTGHLALRQPETAVAAADVRDRLGGRAGAARGGRLDDGDCPRPDLPTSGRPSATPSSTRCSARCGWAR